MKIKNKYRDFTFDMWALTIKYSFSKFPTSILLGLLLVISPPSSAAEFSGKYLMQICASDKGGNELVEGGHIACQGYIAGVLDYHSLIKSLKTAPGVDFCVPKNTSLGVLQRVIVRYLMKNAQHDGFIASPAVALALNEAYPCHKKKNR